MSVLVGYVPHGINHTIYFPIENPERNEKYQKFKNSLIPKGKEFIVFWNNRNIRRKHPADVILAYKVFCEKLSKAEADKCLLLLHTDPIDENGTNLFAVIEAVCPDYSIQFTNIRVDPEFMNYLYNMADVTLNIASNEGFGLSNAESIMACTPVVSNTTGGLQDLSGFVDEHNQPMEFNQFFTSNHTKKYTSHGEWVRPVYPTNRALEGSPATPYIFDDRCNFEDVGEAIFYWYKKSPEDRLECGKKGREWMMKNENGFSAKHMGERFITSIEYCIENFQPSRRFNLYKIEQNTNKISDYNGIVW